MDDLPGIVREHGCTGYDSAEKCQSATPAAKLATVGSRPPQPGRWGETIAQETVVEYAVTTYGRECLPKLLDALDTHTTWEDLLPAVFGVSAAAFEFGWQNYLASHYYSSQ